MKRVTDFCPVFEHQLETLGPNFDPGAVAMVFHDLSHDRQPHTRPLDLA